MNFAIRYLTEYRHETPVTDNLFVPRKEAGAAVDTHAWAEALLPPGDGPAHPDPRWIGPDPTNPCLVGEHMSRSAMAAAAPTPTSRRSRASTAGRARRRQAVISGPTIGSGLAGWATSTT